MTSSSASTSLSRLGRSRNERGSEKSDSRVKIYLLTAAVGLLVGVIYGVLNVRSPAPPVVALVGLLGILVGEQVVPLAKRLYFREPVTAAWAKQQCVPHIFGRLPGTGVGAVENPNTSKDEAVAK